MQANPSTAVQMYLQLGAFLSRVNAEQLCNKLAANQLDKSFIAEGPSGSHTVYRVRIGPLTTVEEADTLATRVSELGMGTPSVVID